MTTPRSGSGDVPTFTFRQMSSPRTVSIAAMVTSFVLFCCAVVALQYFMVPRRGAAAGERTSSNDGWFRARGDITRRRRDGDGDEKHHDPPPSSSATSWDRWEDARASFFEGLDQTTCVFPRVYEPDGVFHERDFRGHGFVVKDSDGAWRLRRGRSAGALAANADDGNATGGTNLTIEGGRGVGGASSSSRGNMTFVHVGKAGGTSVSCDLRIARKYFHCGRGNVKDTDDFPPPGRNESSISRHVNCYVHYNLNRNCYHVNWSFLINVRNPIRRIASWYVYEHIANFGVSRLHMPNYYCGQLMLYTCYPTLDHLATVGLAGRPPPGPPSPTNDDGGTAGGPLRVGTDLTSEECRGWAQAAVRGYVPADLHNAFNYDWYARPLLELDGEEATVYVIRIEHLESDWSTIDRMVGGTGDPPSLSLHRNEAASKPLVVSNMTVSPEGISNLCRVLCREVGVYLRLLERAVNLDASDVETSMEELRRVCPREVVDVAARGKCPKW